MTNQFFEHILIFYLFLYVQFATSDSFMLNTSLKALEDIFGMEKRYLLQDFIDFFLHQFISDGFKYHITDRFKESFGCRHEYCLKNSNPLLG